jgi:hypothetical protein
MNNMSIKQAATELSRLLVRYANDNTWYCVGYDDSTIIIYTQTRRRANELASSWSSACNGYPVKGRAFGKVRLVARQGT